MRYSLRVTVFLFTNTNPFLFNNQQTVFNRFDFCKINDLPDKIQYACFILTA